MSNPAMLRLFVAINIPESVRTLIVPVIHDLKGTGADVRWELPEKLHVTLKFLGDTRENLVDRIGSRIEEVCRPVPPFPLRYSGVGCFPDEKRPRVIWVGIEDPSGSLPSLAAQIDDAMSAFEFEREKRSFTAHLTIGRVKGPRRINLLLRTMEKVNFQSESVTVRGLVLVRSQLGAGGSVYTTLRHAPLAGVLPDTG